ncbi:hypothetical protein Tco_1149931, partial [Tanacetum coccineum]
MPRTSGTHDDEADSSRPKRTRVHETVEEAMLPCVHHEFLLWELCNEFYSTYEFDEVVTDEELIMKKLINFRGLKSDEHFNAKDYWLSISSEDELHLSRIATQTIRRPIHKVLQKMITYGLCPRTTRYDKIQRNELWLTSMFKARHQNGMARKMSLLTNAVLDGLSAPIYCRSLDATTLRELIGSNGRLIAEDPAPSVPRVAMPRPPRQTMQDLYVTIGSMEIRQ